MSADSSALYHADCAWPDWGQCFRPALASQPAFRRDSLGAVDAHFTHLQIETNRHMLVQLQDIVASNKLTRSLRNQVMVEMFFDSSSIYFGSKGRKRSTPMALRCVSNDKIVRKGHETIK
jgi:hypothetical protein